MKSLNDVIQGLLGSTPVGISGGIAPTPQQQYLSAAASNAQIPQYNSALQNAASPFTMPVLSISVAQTKITQQTHLLVSKLPVSIASRLTTCEFYKEHRDEPARFVLTFDNMRSLVFYDIDVFPSDEHIARIALECP